MDGMDGIDGAGSKRWKKGVAEFPRVGRMGYEMASDFGRYRHAIADLVIEGNINGA